MLYKGMLEAVLSSTYQSPSQQDHVDCTFDLTKEHFKLMFLVDCAFM